MTLRAERPVDLVPQIANVHVDDVRAILVFHLPRPLEQVNAREHLARAAHEHLKQLQLLRRERDLDVASPHSTGREIEAEIADPQDRLPLDRARAERARAPARTARRNRTA